MAALVLRVAPAPLGRGSYSSPKRPPSPQLAGFRPSPDRADALLQRGRDFGQSRVVCDAHWQSDVDAGRVISAAAVARLHADPAFRSDLEVARKEVAAARTTPATPAANCAAESAALAKN